MRDIVQAGVVRSVITGWRQDAERRRAFSKIDAAADAIEQCASELESELARALESNRLVSVQAYARSHNVDPATVRRWCMRGQLAAEKNQAGDWEIPQYATRQRKSA
jgi:hypothetical protein